MLLGRWKRKFIIGMWESVATGTQNISGIVQSGHGPEPFRERGRGEERGEPRIAARRPKVQKAGPVTKMSGFYRKEPLGEGQPCPWLESSEDRVWQVAHTLELVGTEGCWENPETRSVLIGSTSTSAAGPGFES